MSRLDHYEFPRPLAIEVGAACCPTHGADVESLRRAAESQPFTRAATTAATLRTLNRRCCDEDSTAAPLSLAILLSAGVAKAQSASRPASASPVSSLPRRRRRIALSRRPRPRRHALDVHAGDVRNPSGGAVAADYRLVPGDKLNIEVYKDAQLSQSAAGPAGRKDHAAAGRRRPRPKAGPRPSCATRSSTSLKEYNTNPVVTVIVVETVPPVFYVMGEVNAPGTLPLKGQISVVQALAMAGGFKDFAKKKDIVIQRKGATGGQHRCRSTTTTRSRAGRRWSTCSPATPSSFRKPGRPRHEARDEEPTCVAYRARGCRPDRRRRRDPPAAQDPAPELQSCRTPGWSFTPGDHVRRRVRLERRAGDAPADTQADAVGPAVPGPSPSASSSIFSPRTEFSTGYQGYLRRYVEFDQLNGFDQQAYRIAAAADHAAADLLRP